ncbi:MAG TPA: NYN domain-containing protein [Vicinamibacterales bacterium]|nr:NYN domain-containing protein [Vicinamibacterales bacterium]
MPHQERTNIAVFIDFDNIEIGVKTTLGEHFDIGTILEALKERGEVVTKIAYADWTRAGEYSRNLTQHAIRLVQRNLTPGGDKNGADINLALDALEMAFTHPHINAYVIVGGDSDFLSLVEKLKQYDKKVFVVGGRSFTSIILQRNCHEFIAYENLIRRPTPSPRSGRPGGQQTPAQQNSQAAFPVAQAIPIVRRALKILADREVSPQTGLLKSTLLQLDSTFSERSYGASSFLDFVEKLAQAGLVLLKHSGRSVMVELNPAFADEGEVPKPRLEGEVPAGETADNVVAFRPAADQPATESQPVPASAPVQAGEAASRLGDNADGVRAASQLLTAATTARWPMYLRNVKQILRAGNLDERRYGFGGLMDLLKACQRDGLVRIERDRRGGLRVFQGPNMARPVQTPQPEPEEVNGNVGGPEMSAAELADDVPQVQVDVTDDGEPDIIEIEPVSVVDTTAELLGRAKPRAPRARAGRTGVAAAPATPAARTRSTGSAGGARKTGAKKPAAKKPASRSRKPVNKDDDDFGNR